MSTSQNVFPVFLQGTHETKGNEYIRSLPQEIRHKIWLEYALTLSYKEIINKSLFSILELKLDAESEKDMHVLFEKVFVPAFKASNLDAMKMAYAKCNIKFDCGAGFLIPCHISNSCNSETKCYTRRLGKSDFICFLQSKKKNTIQVMEWLRSIKYPFCFMIYHYIIHSGRIDVIVWLHRNQIVSTIHIGETLKVFFKNAELEFILDDLNYIFDHFRSLEEDKRSYYENTVYSDKNIEKLKFLATNKHTRNVQVDWNKLLIDASLNNSFSCFEWIAENKDTQIDWVKLLIYASLNNSSFCFKWIAENKLEKVNVIDRRYLFLLISHYVRDKNQTMIDWFYENIPCMKSDMDIFISNFE